MTREQIDISIEELIDRFIDRFIERPFKYLAFVAIGSGLVMFARAWWWILTEGPR